MLTEKAERGLDRRWRVVEVEFLTLAQAAPAESPCCTVQSRPDDRRVKCNHPEIGVLGEWPSAKLHWQDVQQLATTSMEEHRACTNTPDNVIVCQAAVLASKTTDHMGTDREEGQ